MRLLVSFAATIFCSSLWSQDTTALAALKLIAKDRAVRLARIEARDGTPNPDRWYFLVHDPADENGVREFVVANNEIVAARPLSQFAEKLQPQDVIGGAAVKIDSDQLAKMLRQYAQANGATIGKINYELKKEGADAAPVWKVSGLDESDQRVGELVVTAGKGNVISHEGFAVSPPAATPKRTTKFDVYAETEVAKSASTPASREEDEQSRESRRRDREVDEHEHPVGNAMKNVGRSIRRFLPF